ncbi:MAG: Fic family protein [Fusobacterium gastrosuis]|uniref:Fic/DOC family protein n=1 Tax=Fusobacterium gastrosuis TaxID=1755100 RepID=UPI00297B8E53|nr:Fic family protein [Fusobacteriaceae bacterium]MDY4011008.1 Fic family protein [Fusobacterium gastrosuis]MDY5713540.1 Fic family protein [Fusobacterium gastrosuis]
MIDPYVYPGTTILKNKLNIRDDKELNIKERGLTASRIEEFSRREVQKEFNFEYLKSIHKYIFQDIYEWAGEIRKGDISKGNSLFCKAVYIESYASDIFRNLKKNNYFHDIENKEILSKKLAETFLDINALHPFREGNGRTQREFIRSLAKSNGYELNFSNINREEMIKFSSLNVDYSNQLAEKFYNGMEKINKKKLETEYLLNYNAFTGNRINITEKVSDENRWIAKADIIKHNIELKEGAKGIKTEIAYIEENKLYKAPITYYNISELHITKEIEQKFIPMKEQIQSKKNQKSKDIGIER